MTAITPQEVRNVLTRAGHKGAKTVLRNSVGVGGFKVVGTVRDPFQWVTYRLGDSENRDRAQEIKRDACQQYETALVAAGYTVENRGDCLVVSK